MLALTSVSDLLQLVTGSAADVEVHASWAVLTTSGDTPARKISNISAATTTDIVTSPASGEYHVVKSIVITNTDFSVVQTCILQLTDGTLTSKIFGTILDPGESLHYEETGRFSVRDANGIEIQSGSIDPSLYVLKAGDSLTGHLETIAGAANAQVPQAQETAMLANTQLAGYRNKVRNGNFRIKQRPVAGSVVLGAGVFGHDCWKAGAGGCTYTFSILEGIVTINISAGSLIQVLDGDDLFTGNHTLSWTGTAQGKIGAGSYGVSGQTALVTGGSNLSIEFNTGTLSLVQFEPGLRKTLFEHRMTELFICQRYAVRMPRAFLQCFSTTQAFGVLTLPVPMRAIPPTPAGTFNVTTSGGASTACALTIGAGESGTFNVSITGATGLAAGNSTVLLPPADTILSADI